MPKSRCRHCWEMKDAGEFYPSRPKHCKECANFFNMRWRRNNDDVYRPMLQQYRRKWTVRNRLALLMYHQMYRMMVKDEAA